MTKIAKLMDTLSEADRRQVAYFIHRTYGGTLSGAQRAAAFRQRWEQLPPPRNEVTSESNGIFPLPDSATSPTQRGFSVPASVLEALSKSRILGAVVRLRTAEFWQAEVRANPGVNFAAEVYKAEAWMAANAGRAPRKNYARFLHSWLSRADRGETE